MRIANLEYKKSIFIIILLLLCVFQLGILWSEKNPGIPFPFSSRMRLWNSNENIDLDEVKKNYYCADAIIVSNGKRDLYYPLEPGSSLYRAVWNDMQNSYLKQIIEKKPVLSDRNWYSLIKMKCIVVQFKNPIPTGIIRWFTGAEPTVPPAVKQIYKIAIFPSESINYSENILYVYDSENVYKYTVTIGQDGMKRDDYIKAIDTIDNGDVFPMNRLVASYPSVENPELLVSLIDSEKKIWDLLVKTPNEIVFNNDNIDRIDEYLLEDYRSSIVTKFSEDGTNLIFSNEERVYRYYMNGFLDYQYRNKNSGDKGLVEEALEKAITFIEYRKKNLVDGADICLSSVNKDDDGLNYYIFTFDYVMDGMEIKILNDRDKTVKSAITVCANRDRVVDVKWYIKTFAYNDYYTNYNLNFYNF
ncbi:MAG TPA: hypothetical protein GXZ70_01885, partial [Clostridiales bacterium]|nr:hypothetical protein [Clostridiales bacterium]